MTVGIKPSARLNSERIDKDAPSHLDRFQLPAPSPFVNQLFAAMRRLAGDTARAATSDEVKDLRREAQALKEVVADLTLENRLLKKSMIADGGDEA
jgi:hypothetical protein